MENKESNCVSISDEENVDKKYPQSMELKVVMQKEITTWLHRSLPLCMILAYEKHLPWYYSKFIQIFSYTNETGRVELEYMEPRNRFDEIVEWINLGYRLINHIENIIDYIIENVNFGYHLIIHVDEFYLPDKWTYNKVHFVHPALIYGYDNKEKKLKGIGFTKGIFKEISFDYTQFSDAFKNGKIYYEESAPWCEYVALQLMRPKKSEIEYPFVNDIFLKELNNYLFSIGDSVRLFSYSYDESRVEYGFKVHDVIIRGLESLLQGKNTIDYRACHLIAEHKKCIYDRIGYFIARNNLSGEIIILHTEYLEIVKKFNIFRIKILKNLKDFGNANIYNPNISDLNLEQKSKVKESINMIKELKDAEYDILIKILDQLEKQIKLGVV